MHCARVAPIARHRGSPRSISTFRLVALLDMWHCYSTATAEAVMRAVGYVRVSTEEQASSGVSLEAQQQQITGYAMMKGWQVAEFFIERGVSGSVALAERPEGQRLLPPSKPAT